MSMRIRGPIQCNVAGKELLIRGVFLRTARLRSEYYVQVGELPAFVQELRKSGVRADVVTLLGDVNHPIPKYSFFHEPEKVAVLPITTYDEWFTTRLYNKPRNALRKALKTGIEVRREEFSESLLKGIKSIYDESPVRQGKRNRHFHKDLGTLELEHGTFLDRSQFVAAYFAGEMIGFAKVTFCQEFGMFMNFLSKVSYRNKAVNNAILAKAVEVCAERGLKCLVYGVLGGGGSHGLDEFKIANGFECVEVPRYFIPLTWTGKMSLKVGLHRGLTNRMPEWCLRAAAKARARWNAWRFTAPRAA
jgi:hypothetical protein